MNRTNSSELQALTRERGRSFLAGEGMLKLLSTQHLLVEKPFGRRWLVLRRTPAEWASVSELSRVFQQAAAVLRRADHEKLGLLVDLRLAPHHQDRLLEKAAADEANKLPSFRRVALLVSAPVSVLTAQRQARSIPGQVTVFTSEEEAFAHLDAL